MSRTQTLSMLMLIIRNNEWNDFMMPCCYLNLYNYLYWQHVYRHLFPSHWNVVLSLLKKWHVTAVYIFMSDRWKLITGMQGWCMNTSPFILRFTKKRPTCIIGHLSIRGSTLTYCQKGSYLYINNLSRNKYKSTIA